MTPAVIHERRAHAIRERGAVELDGPRPLGVRWAHREQKERSCTAETSHGAGVLEAGSLGRGIISGDIVREVPFLAVLDVDGPCRVQRS